MFRNYTSIGDSYASGAGDVRETGRIYLEYDPKWECKRTRDGYPWQFYQKYLLNDLEAFNDVACSGANTTEVGQQIDTGPSVFSIKEDRLGYEFGTPDLVTISAGGNNGEVVWLIVDRCIKPLSRVSVDSEEYKEMCSKAIKEAHEPLDVLQPQLEALYSQAKVHNILPDQKRSVYVLGYMQLWNSQVTRDECYGKDDIYVPPLGPDSFGSQMNDLLVKLNNIIKAAAEAQEVTYVDIDAGFEGHRICDKEDYPNEHVEIQKSFYAYIFNRDKYAPFHPTADGYTIMMEALAAAITAGEN